MVESESVGSEVPIDAALLPETPAGYAPPRRFHYPTLLLFAGSAALLVAAAVVFGGLLWIVQGPRVLDAAVHVEESPGVVEFSVDGTIGLAAVVAAFATAAAHEGLHGLAYRRRGYEVSYGVAPRMGAFYAAAFHQFQTREDNLRVAFAPLAVITALCTPLLFVPIPLIATTALVALIVNTSGAIGDLYAAWRIRGMPPGTLLYDADIRHFYFFEPLDA